MTNGITANPALGGLVQLSVLDENNNIVTMNGAVARFLGLPLKTSGVPVPGLAPDGRYAMHWRMLKNLRETGRPQCAVVHGYSTHEIRSAPDVLRYTEVYLSTAPGYEGHVVWCSLDLSGLSASLIDLISAGGGLRYSADCLPSS